MIEVKSNTFFQSRIEICLQRIASLLLINASFIDNLGLLNGKMGIAIFFFQYSRFTRNKVFEDFAGELLDEIYEEINQNTPLDFKNGLIGIGWGIEYLVRNKFVDAKTDEILAEIDKTLTRENKTQPLVINNDDLFGHGLYYISRFTASNNEPENYNTNQRKEYLIQITEECIQILVKNRYRDYNILPEKIITFISLVWFLLEVQKKGLCVKKIETALHLLPKYIIPCWKCMNEKPEKFFLLLLIENINMCREVKVFNRSFSLILDEYINKEKDSYDSEDVMIDNFIRCAYLNLIYESFSLKSIQFYTTIEKIFSIVNDDKNWNQRLTKINKNSLGITGFAGLGLGFLYSRI